MTTSVPLPEHWQDLVAGYVLGDLDAAEIALVNQWRTQYPQVEVELAALQGTWNALPQALPPQTPPAPLRGRILAVAQPQGQSPPAAVLETPRQEPRSRPQWPLYGAGLGWAATALALAVVVVENQQLRQQTGELETVVAQFSRPSNPVYTLAGTDVYPQATGRLVIDAQAQYAVIATEALPPLPPGEAYRLWALADSDPVYCGQFNPTGGDLVQQWQLLNQDCQSTSVQMLITHESATAPPTPQGPLVLQAF